MNPLYSELWLKVIFKKMKQLIVIGLILLSGCSIFNKKKDQTIEEFAQHFFQDFKVGKFDWIMNQYATEDQSFEQLFRMPKEKIDTSNEEYKLYKLVRSESLDDKKETFQKSIAAYFKKTNTPPRDWSNFKLDSIGTQNGEQEFTFYVSDNDFVLELQIEGVYKSRTNKIFFESEHFYGRRSRLNKYKRFDAENNVINAQEAAEKLRGEDDQIFMAVEQSPNFPGGETALMDYLNNNLKYPAKAKKDKIEGIVYVDFTVNKIGEIQDIKIRKPYRSGLDKEAIRLVKSMPKWSPGRQAGEAVKVQFTLPVSFKLD